MIARFGSDRHATRRLRLLCAGGWLLLGLARLAIAADLPSQSQPAAAGNRGSAKATMKPEDVSQRHAQMRQVELKLAEDKLDEAVELVKQVVAIDRQMAASDPYRNLWEKKLGEFDALQQAQLTMLRRYDPQDGQLRGAGAVRPVDPAKLAAAKEGGGQRLSPSYWGAFVLSGDWK
jgi:hypothetical protein